MPANFNVKTFLFENHWSCWYLSVLFYNLVQKVSSVCYLIDLTVWQFNLFSPGNLVPNTSFSLPNGQLIWLPNKLHKYDRCWLLVWVGLRKSPPTRRRDAQELRALLLRDSFPARPVLAHSIYPEKITFKSYHRERIQSTKDTQCSCNMRGKISNNHRHRGSCLFISDPNASQYWVSLGCRAWCLNIRRFSKLRLSKVLRKSKWITDTSISSVQILPIW